MVSEILELLARTNYDTLEKGEGVIQCVWGLLESEIYLHVKTTLNILTNMIKDEPQFHDLMLAKGLAKELCEFVEEEDTFGGVLLSLL